MNLYRNILENNLPRLFNLYNLDPCSSTRGYGDRLYWGWKISDFANGTMQGGIHALSIAMKLGLIGNREFALAVINSAVTAIPEIRAKNGSLVEAYPNEHSFCVTALVAFDVLSAIRHLGSDISPHRKDEYIDIVRPLISFIIEHDEKHAIISNHLATAAAAIALWNEITGERCGRGEELLDIIYSHQSQEGWYREYEGADPGYQTLCTYYLSCAYEVTQDHRLLESLKRSGAFLKHFVHPDGTIGGLYGSRNTEVYYPGGMVALAPTSDDFAILANMLHNGVVKDRHIFPQDIDMGNFIPLVNTYAVAALHYEKNRDLIEGAPLPAPCEGTFTRTFGHAGIYIHSTKRYYAIVNYKKGGTLKVFDKATGMLDTEEGGIFGRLAKGERFSSQHFDGQITFNNCTIEAHFYTNNESYPTPFAHIMLRLLSLTLFRSLVLGNVFKKYIVKFLMTGKNKIDGRALLRFEFLNDKIIIHKNITKPRGCRSIGHYGTCKAIHMASSGYYLKQDQERPSHAGLVRCEVEEE